MVTVLHAPGRRVDAVWCDRDDAGPRMWHRVVDPWGVERWCTSSQLEQLLRRHGLSSGDLSMVEPGDSCE